jgi:hypothetical protein
VVSFKIAKNIPTLLKLELAQDHVLLAILDTLLSTPINLNPHRVQLQMVLKKSVYPTASWIQITFAMRTVMLTLPVTDVQTAWHMIRFSKDA